mgnify:CR=1 FL=1
MQIKYLAIGFSILVFSCGLLETEDENNNLDMVYIALQGLDQVGIVNSENGDLKVVDIDYNPQMKETPHFIVIDEINRYWFVTTIVSGYVGRYNMDTDELNDTLFIGDSPALMVANEIDKILYVSRMMPMGSMMTGSMSTVVQEIDYSDSSKMELSNEFSIDSPAPHGIAINSTGSEVFVTSNTADWIYKINSRLALTYATMGKLDSSKQYYSIANDLYNSVYNKKFWTLYKINQIYNNNDLAMAYLDSSYNKLLDTSMRYTNKHERQIYLDNDKFNQRIQKEWAKVK